MTGKPLKKPSRKGNRVCSRLNLGRKNLHGSSFNSRLTFSWIQKQHCNGWETSGEKEATDWMSNTKATMVAQSLSGWLRRCPHCKRALGRLCRINKQSRVGNCCIVRDCEFLRIAWLVVLQCSRCLERANWEQTTPQGRRSDLKTIKWKVGQQWVFFLTSNWTTDWGFTVVAWAVCGRNLFTLFSTSINFSI